ncbi:MAG TPA: DUF2249 domain-containing protein [Lysobacter sp.]
MPGSARRAPHSRRIRPPSDHRVASAALTWINCVDIRVRIRHARGRISTIRIPHDLDQSCGAGRGARWHFHPTGIPMDTDSIATTFTPHPFDARGIARRFRHSAIFGALDALQAGEAMRFVNDHDPLPLLDQLRQRYGERIAIEYRQRDPGVIVIDFNIVGA